MPRNAFYFISCSLAIAGSIVMVTLSAVLDTKAETRQSASGVPEVRAYYAAINDYLRTGDAATLPAGEQETGAVSPELIELAALRQSYPDLSFEIEVIEGAGNSVIAGISSRFTWNHMPGWIDSTAPEGAGPTPVAFRTDSGAIVERMGGACPNAAFLDMVSPNTQFSLNSPARFALANLKLQPDEGVVILPLPGPGIFIVRRGGIAVEGNGSTEIAMLRSHSWEIIPAGATRNASAGDAIAVPTDKALIEVRGIAEVVITGLLPILDQAPRDPSTERERGFSSSENLTLVEVLQRSPIQTQKTWFGSVEPLANSARMNEAKLLTIDAGWLVVPAGQQVTIRQEAGVHLLVDSVDGLVVEQTDPEGDVTVTNIRQASTAVIVARVVESPGTVF